MTKKKTKKKTERELLDIILKAYESFVFHHLSGPKGDIEKALINRYMSYNEYPNLKEVLIKEGLYEDGSE